MTPKENEELIKYRFEKAKVTFAEAELQLKNELWNVAVNRLYYACYYAVSALLAGKEIYTRTDSDNKQMFSLHFLTTGIISEAFGDFYIELFRMKESSEFEDYCDYAEEDVVPLFAPAKDLINAIEQILYNK
jgi:uncharacterized protein (UPF0332 family)